MNINIRGPLNSTSYGVVCTNTVKELMKAHKVAFWPITVEEATLKQHDFSSCLNNVHSADLDLAAPSLTIWHQFQLAESIGKGPRCAWSFFELDRLRPVEVNHINSLDLFIVASKWAKEVAIASGVKTRIEVVPLGVDPRVFATRADWNRAAMRQNMGFAEDDYVFTVLGKFEIRKLSDLIPALFKKAFPAEKNVKLVVSCINPCIAPEENAAWLNLYQDERFRLIKNRFYSQEDVAKLMYVSDCGLCLSRAEAWNLPLCEFLAMEKPVITTDYAGHTEFCKEEFSYLVQIDQLEPAFDGRWFFGDGQWATIGVKQEEQIIEFMRNAQRKGPIPNPNPIRTEFTWANSVNKLVSVLSAKMIASHSF